MQNESASSTLFGLAASPPHPSNSLRRARPLPRLRRGRGDELIEA
ncbi:hypothetical protein RBSH_01665 [Rhodopirellula baltica SH28]|uniref:Uncharacterized protein n=1 Tax=Rhodopirellula baltica SH28 TaxID=993517 RepID=K5D8A0_RHOBT|nr:hypothetical protein RBSH_01665 [Rhodopirellula baltica SH28]